MPQDSPNLYRTTPRMSPMDELELMDLQVEHAAIDEERTMFDPDAHPKLPHPKEEGVTDLGGTRTVDVMADTPAVDDVLGVNLTEDELLNLGNSFR